MTADASTLQTTDSELHDLAKIDDAARAGTTTLRVPADALRHLLRDHYTLVTALRERRLITVNQPDMESLR